MSKSGIFSIFNDLGLKVNKVLMKFVIMIWRYFLYPGGQRNCIDEKGKQASQKKHHSFSIEKTCICCIEMAYIEPVR